MPLHTHTCTHTQTHMHTHANTHAHTHTLAHTQTFSYFGIWLDSFWKQNKLFHLVNYLCFAWRFFWFICRFATSWLRGFVASRFCWLARWLAIYWLATGCFGRNRFRFNFYILLLFYVIFTWFVVVPKLPKYSVFFLNGENVLLNSTHLTLTLTNHQYLVYSLPYGGNTVSP